LKFFRREKLETGFGNIYKGKNKRLISVKISKGKIIPVISELYR